MAHRYSLFLASEAVEREALSNSVIAGKVYGLRHTRIGYCSLNELQVCGNLLWQGFFLLSYSSKTKSHQHSGNTSACAILLIHFPKGAASCQKGVTCHWRMCEPVRMPPHLVHTLPLWSMSKDWRLNLSNFQSFPSWVVPHCGTWQIDGHQLLHQLQSKPGR